jgi:hypothetical protein
MSFALLAPFQQMASATSLSTPTLKTGYFDSSLKENLLFSGNRDIFLYSFVCLELCVGENKVPS